MEVALGQRTGKRVIKSLIAELRKTEGDEGFASCGGGSGDHRFRGAHVMSGASIR